MASYEQDNRDWKYRVMVVGIGVLVAVAIFLGGAVYGTYQVCP